MNFYGSDNSYASKDPNLAFPSPQFDIEDCKIFRHKKIFSAIPNNSLSAANSTGSLNPFDPPGSTVKIFTETMAEAPSLTFIGEDFELFTNPEKKLVFPVIGELNTSSRTIKGLPLIQKEVSIQNVQNQQIVNSQFKATSLKLSLNDSLQFNGSQKVIDRPETKSAQKTVEKKIVLPSQKHSHIPNYNLKRTIFVYFYHRKGIDHYAKKYPIDEKELAILKLILKKKLIYDKKHFRKDYKVIDDLTLNNYIDFLKKTPPIFRKNIIKSKLFKKISKHILCNNKISKSVCENINLKEDFSQMTSAYYKLCFDNQQFKREFFNSLENKEILKSVIKKCKLQLVNRIDEWIISLEKNIACEKCRQDGKADQCDKCVIIKNIRMATSAEEIDEAKRQFSCYI